jgi:hypothetical protein
MLRAVILVGSCLVATAHASPKRVVVIDFEGPRKLADPARAIVLKVLGDRYDVVSSKRWQVAMMATPSHGPLDWASAAKAAGVDAIIEGWVDPEGGRTHPMTIAVLEASSGKQIDTVTVLMSDQGVVSDDATLKLSRNIDELMAWVDGEAMLAIAEPPPVQLPPVYVASYPSAEPVIEIRLTGGFHSHHEGAVIWADGTVQLNGPHCTQRSSLTPLHVGALLATLDRAGIFAASSRRRNCRDGLEYEVDVRIDSRRVAAHGTSCGDDESVAEQAYDLVASALSKNLCVANETRGDD